MNGYFSINNSKILNTSAVSSVLVELFDSAYDSNISHSQIHSNSFISFDEMLRELEVKCDRMCFIHLDTAVLASLIRESMRDIKEKPFLLLSFSSSLTISDCSIFSNDAQLLSSYTSSISFLNTDIHSFSLQQSTLINLISSSLNMIHVAMTNVTKHISNNHSIIHLFSVSSDSKFSCLDSSFSDLISPF